MKTEFSTLDIVKLLNIPRERLREWIDRRYIRPSIKEAEGHGRKALFSLADLYRIEIFNRLTNVGLHRVVGLALTNFLKEEILLRDDIYHYVFARPKNKERGKVFEIMYSDSPKSSRKELAGDDLHIIISIKRVREMVNAAVNK